MGSPKELRIIVRSKEVAGGSLLTSKGSCGTLFRLRTGVLGITGCKGLDNYQLQEVMQHICSGAT